MLFKILEELKQKNAVKKKGSALKISQPDRMAMVHDTAQIVLLIPLKILVLQ